MSRGWAADVLGAGFEQLTLDLGRDDEGPVVATLVRCTLPAPGTVGRRTSRVPLADIDVLYVHGWSDFFFQTDLAAFWNSLGARFYALDLRKYGRSLRPGQTPGYISDLTDYDADIQSALNAIAEDPAPVGGGARRLVLLGHSTGGLILSLWASRHVGAASALVLNSPWLEFQTGSIVRGALEPVLRLHADFNPRATQPHVDLGFYSRALAELGTLPSGVGDPAWRPSRGFDTHPAWLAAVLKGHRLVNGGKVDVACPAFVMLSARSTPPIAWTPEMTSTDSVLVVDDIARAAIRLGALVTIARIEGAVHDVFLSSARPRAAAFAALRRWLTAPGLRA